MKPLISPFGKGKRCAIVDVSLDGAEGERVGLAFARELLRSEVFHYVRLVSHGSEKGVRVRLMRLDHEKVFEPGQLVPPRSESVSNSRLK